MNKNLRHIASIISPYTRGENILLSSLTLLKRKKHAAPIPELLKTIKSLAPGLKVISQIRAGRTFYLPAYLTEKSSTYYALRWSLSQEGFHPKIPWAQRLVTNLLEASQKTGMAYKLKKELNATVIQSRINYRPRFKRFKLGRRRKKKQGLRRKIPYLQRKKKILALKRRPSIVNLSYLSDSIPPHVVASFKRKKRIRQRKLLQHFTNINNLRAKAKKKPLKFNIKKRKKLLKTLNRDKILEELDMFKDYTENDYL